MTCYRIVRLIFLLGVLLSVGASANAQRKDIGVQPAGGLGRQVGYANSWALVIGINRYQHSGIEKLRAAVSDAKAMKALLPSLGFTRIISLLDQDATRARIEQELYGTLKQMGPNDRLLIFFSGHGKRVDLPKGGEEVLPQLGSLAIRAKVPGVEVWLDDRRIGETKAGRVLVAEKLPAGAHRVKGSKVGYQEWEREVKVVKDARAEVLIDLEPLRPASPEVLQGKDGAEMVLVPAGEFTMGSPQGEGYDNERPQHQVYLDAFYIDKYEVTNARYRHCVEVKGFFTRGCTPPSKRDWYDDPQRADHPVVFVDWEQAQAYCRWAGRRLPSEAEWEKAARGTDGRVYPWGNDFGSGHANVSVEEDGYEFTAPVGSFSSGASPYGALDMAGNVWEWVADWYDGNYYARSPSRNPQGPESGSERVVRGSSWLNNQHGARAAVRGRGEPGDWSDPGGFRCAQDFPKEDEESHTNEIF